MTDSRWIQKGDAMRRNIYKGILVCTLLLLTACGVQSQEMEKVNEVPKKQPGIREEYREAYEKDPDGIDFFCEYMEVEKDKLTLYHNFTDNNGISCFEIGVDKMPEKTGTYMMYQYTEESDAKKYWRLMRGVSDRELDDMRDRYNLSHNNALSIYEVLYDGIWEKGLDGLSPVKPEIDASGVKEYTETLLGTNPIWEAYSGYVNAEGDFCVSYVGDVSDGWRQGVFQDGKWKTWQMPALEDKGPDYYFFMGNDNRIWHYDSSSKTLLRLYGKKGKVLGEIDVSVWMKKNGLVNKGFVDVVAVTDHEAIFNFTDQEGRDRGFLVDVTTGKPEKEYASSIRGTCYGDYVYEYFSSGNDILKIVNWKTGECTGCLDLSGIRREYSRGGYYVGYLNVMDRGLRELTNDEIPGIEDGREPIRYCVYEDHLYFSFFSGVYRYNPEENKLEKLVDGSKLPKFQEMYGDFAVGKGESIYLLGFLGGGDDEGATDFLYLTKK